MASQQILLGSTAADSGTDIYPDDNFRMLDYKGNGSSGKQISNGITFADGGMVMIKNWEGSEDTYIIDTVRGANKYVRTSDTAAESTDSSLLESFNSDGITVGNSTRTNTLNERHLAYCFRKRAKFFDIVTYSGSGSGQSIAHSLGCVPGMIWVKNLTSNAEWGIYHRGLNNGSNPHDYRIRFPGFTQESAQDYWNDTAPTSTHFSVGADVETGQSGNNYVAYLFAHAESAFGENENKHISYCGYYTGQGSSPAELKCNFEPQFLIINRVTGGTSYHYVLDNQRGMTNDTQNDPWFGLNDTSNSSGYNFGYFDHESFWITPNNADINHSGSRYIFYAVRAQDGITSPATPKSGADVFDVSMGNNASGHPQHKTNWKPSLVVNRNPTATENWNLWYRGVSTVHSGQHLMLNLANTISGNSSYVPLSHEGFMENESNVQNDWFFAWRESSGFHRRIYKGTGGVQNVYHNLGGTPEMMWVKSTSDSNREWIVYHKDMDSDPSNHYMKLMTNDTPISNGNFWQGQLPTSSYFKLGTDNDVNKSGDWYIAFLFRSVSGISKVGGYTGASGGGATVTCGFQPRFVFIKSTDSSSNRQWVFLDTARGWGSGDDKYITLGSNNATDQHYDHEFGAPTSTGFTMPNHQWVGYDGEDYIYYAHA